jgi:hypothetical protein
MNVDEILQSLNSEQVDYLLIGGMNFLLRHEPELTFDVDIWVQDQPANLGRLNRAFRIRICSNARKLCHKLKRRPGASRSCAQRSGGRGRRDDERS